jgi:MSHA type pilus biogenesis protein MshL
MKYAKQTILTCSFFLLSLTLVSCTNHGSQDQQSEMKTSPTSSALESTTMPKAKKPDTLPVVYQTPTYVIEKEAAEDLGMNEEAKVMVGARITSTRGPQPLWDILKKLANLKGMNVSWASDVDRNVLVDVDIKPTDDFFQAIDNMLRQIDYYHEVEGTTIVVRYKQTRQFQISMPFVKHLYSTKTGGDMLGGTSSGDSGTNVSGELSLVTEGVGIKNYQDGKPGDLNFDIWSTVENNLNALLNIWSTTEVIKESGQQTQQNDGSNRNDQNENSQSVVQQATYRRSNSGNSYFIDKPIGLITVTAPRPIMTRIESYINSLKKELYKQVAIEAKILEVQLDDRSAIGINWNLLMQNLSVASGVYSYTDAYSKNRTDNYSDSYSSTRTTTRDITHSRDGSDNSASDSTAGDSSSSNLATVFSDIATDGISNLANAAASTATIITDGFSRGGGAALSLAAFTFDSFLNAVSQQGQTTILSNPKLSVLNGQPSLMTVGKNITYIDKITSDTDGNTGTVTYTVDTARALSGVGLSLTANILNDEEIILNIVPVTSELEEPIEYRSIGLGEVGLPIINVREMNTTIRVKDGEMLVIGGLIASASSNDDSFLPGTRDIPFFKYLFGYEEKIKRKRELIILLQPRII